MGCLEHSGAYCPPMNGSGIDPLQMMTNSKGMPTEHFVDYSLVYE
jgi:hypothetical protein